MTPSRLTPLPAPRKKRIALVLGGGGMKGFAHIGVMQVVWGTPGLDDVSIQDAVYASCALPGFYPPGRVGARYCVDGGVVDNLPVQVAALWTDIIIAVDVGSSEMEAINDVQSQGFA